MLDDAPRRGRTIQWKYIILLMALAAAALLGALAARRGTSELALRFRNIFQKSTDWMSFPVTPESQLVPLKDGFAAVNGGMLYGADRDGTVLYSLDTGEETLCLKDGTIAAAYSPGGQRLYFLGENRELTVPGGIFAAAIGENGSVAVITGGSGYLTKTVLYDNTGAVTGQIGLAEETMVEASFMENQNLLGLCMDQAGSWHLRCYEGEELLWETRLENTSDCHLNACGDGAAVLSQEAFLFFSPEGEQLGSYPLEEGQAERWCCSDQGFTALVTRQGIKSVLRTVSMDGTVLGEALIDGTVRDVGVCGNRLYVLDLQELQVYDETCALRRKDPEGARAVGVLPCSGGCWLWGSGEIKKIIHS